MVDQNRKNVHPPDVETPTDRKLIEDSVQFINDKANETLYKGSLEIGNYVLKHFFNNDISMALSKNPRKPQSFKALCRHKDLTVPYSTLTVMVRVAAQENFLKGQGIDTDCLGYTHKSMLIKLENNDEKVKLAQTCMEKKLSTRQFQDVINKTKKKMIAQDKKFDEETAFRNIAKLEQMIGRTEKHELVTDINKIRSMQTKTREDLRHKATELLDIMARTSKDCKKILKNLEKVNKEKDG